MTVHPEAFDYVAQFATYDAIDVVEIGARNVNGTARDHFPNADWWGVDAQSGDGVDEVADGASWLPGAPVDLVVCTEVFEHTPNWRNIVANTFRMLVSGGRVVFTCAGPGRAPHGVNIDDPIQPGWYRNISADELEEAMMLAGFAEIDVESFGEDTRATAVKP